MNNGANILATDREQETVTEMAISQDNVQLLELLHANENHLLEHDLHNGNFPLTVTIMKKAQKCFNFIMNLKPSAQMFLFKREYYCPILWSIKKSDVESLKELAKVKDFRQVINEPLTIRFKGETTYLHILR